ncbi:hypothetical protein KL930_003202 [Ogataea haglerorum]|nr:hypothetical protein KL915_002539 [Ogataea haglerorum]KAG7769635.1 hypothetical protein KL931_002881 [Ogataea haglerorum]KAG7776080.1 hypothetical protein KL930_003202 [Ogataea haglerorum]KAG7776819.1 hypothetical protein KL922_003512 [Ogataea haglerorum]
MEDVYTVVERLKLDPQGGLAELERRLRPDEGATLGPQQPAAPENWHVVVGELLEMLAVPEAQWTWFRPSESREQQTLRQHKQAQLQALRLVLQFGAVYDRAKLLDRVSLYYDERHPWSSQESAQAVRDILRRAEPSKDEIFLLMDGYVPMLREFSKVGQHSAKVSARGYRKSQNAADGPRDTPLVGRAPVGEDDRIRTKYMARIGSLAFLVDFLAGSDIEARWNVVFLLLLHYLDDHDVLVKSAAPAAGRDCAVSAGAAVADAGGGVADGAADGVRDGSRRAGGLCARPGRARKTGRVAARGLRAAGRGARGRVPGRVRRAAGRRGRGAAAEDGGVCRGGGETDVLRRARAAAKPVHRALAGDGRRGGRRAGAAGGAAPRTRERAVRRAGVSSEGGAAAAPVRCSRRRRGAGENRPARVAARPDTAGKRPRTKFSSPPDTVKTRRMPKFLTQSREALREKYAEINRREKSRLVDAMRHRAQSAWSYEAGLRNRDRNRYSDVLPFDKNRVRLRRGDNDYINASWLELTCGDGVGRYIAAQGPTAATWGHFWQMCAEQCAQEVVIVMLTPLFEAGREKCYKYWSEKDFCAGDGLVLEFGGARESEGGHFTVRRWTLRDEASGALKPVTQYQFHEWADFSAPEQAASLVELSSSVHSHGSPDPVVVHCSAGVGRSGTFIAVDYFLQHCTASLTAPDTDDARHDLITPVNNHEVQDPVLEIVSELRSQRVLMVQQFEQFAFIYDCLRQYYIDRYLNRT